MLGNERVIEPRSNCDFLILRKAPYGLRALHTNNALFFGLADITQWNADSIVMGIFPLELLRHTSKISAEVATS